MAGDKIRSIKPSIRRDQALGRCSDSAKWLYVVAITMADDHGNLEAAPEVLHAEAFKWGPQRDVEALCRELSGRLVTFYEVEGQRFAHLNGWQKHQRIDNATKPEIPLPPGWVCVVEERREGARVRPRYRSTPALTLADPGVGATGGQLGAPNFPQFPPVTHQSPPGENPAAPPGGTNSPKQGERPPSLRSREQGEEQGAGSREGRAVVGGGDTPATRTTPETPAGRSFAPALHGGKSVDEKSFDLEAVATHLATNLDLLAIRDVRDMRAWAKGLLDDLRLPAGASPLPYVRFALPTLRDAVCGSESRMPSKTRLSTLRTKIEHLIADDKKGGYASGKTDGAEGRCAPPKPLAEYDEFDDEAPARALKRVSGGDYNPEPLAEGWTPT